MNTHDKANQHFKNIYGGQWLMRKTVTFNNAWITMPLSEIVRSSFDHCIAGQIASDGNYYCIYSDHKTHENYAVTKEVAWSFDVLGRTLKEGEPDKEINSYPSELRWGDKRDKHCAELEKEYDRLCDLCYELESKLCEEKRKETATYFKGKILKIKEIKQQIEDEEEYSEFKDYPDTVIEDNEISYGIYNKGYPKYYGFNVYITEVYTED